MDRTRKEFSDDDIAKIARDLSRVARSEARAYEDVPGFCKAATLEEIRAHDYVLTPGRYVGAADVEDDDVPFAERFAALEGEAGRAVREADKLTATIRGSLRELGADG